MMRDTQSPTRQEVSDRQEGYADEMEHLQDELDETADDIQVIRDLIEQIDPGGGTAEGMDDVDQSADRAEDVTERVFDDQDAELTDVSDENQDYGEEVDERTQVTETNLGKISDATAPLTTQEAVSEIRAAKEAMVQDVEILQEVVHRIEDNAVRSAEVQERLRQIRRSEG
jgi:Xaa-Pro aminopeptidase